MALNIIPGKGFITGRSVENIIPGAGFIGETFNGLLATPSMNPMQGLITTTNSIMAVNRLIAG